MTAVAQVPGINLLPHRQAARRASVQRRLDAAKAAGLTPVIMDSEALALQAALAQGGWQALSDGGVAYQLAWGLAMHRYAR